VAGADTPSVYHGGSHTDDDMEMTGVEPPKRIKPPGPSLRVSVVLIVAGIALAIPTLIAGIAPIVRAVTTSAGFEAPNVIRMHLGKGNYMIYEDTGTNSPFATNDSVTITASDVTVTGPDGANVEVFERGTIRETLSSGDHRYVGAVRFTTPRSGDYTVGVRNTSPTSVLVARPFTDTIKTVLIWFALAGLGGLLLATGVVLLIVGSIRRNRMRSAFAYAASVPPGWHPDPGGSGRWRYWDGYQWTEHLQ
jgi:hypothetical protein